MVSKTLLIVVLLAFISLISSYVLNHELSVDFTSDSNNNGFLCYVETPDDSTKYGTLKIVKYFLPRKQNLTYLGELVTTITNAAGCTISTYKDSTTNTNYIVGASETNVGTSLPLWYASYTYDSSGITFGSFNTIILNQESTPHYFSPPLYPNINVLNGSIFLHLFGGWSGTADKKVLIYYFGDFNKWLTSQYILIPTPVVDGFKSPQYDSSNYPSSYKGVYTGYPTYDITANWTSLSTYQFGYQDYYVTWIQNGVLKTAITLSRFPFGTCQITTCSCGMIYLDMAYTGDLINVTYKSAGSMTINFGADPTKPLPYESYHPSTSTEPSGYLNGYVMSYSNKLFFYSGGKSINAQCYFNLAGCTVSQTLPLLSNDALIFNDTWYITYLDAGNITKLIVAPTYWTGATNFYSPKSLYSTATYALNLPIANNYVNRSELGLYLHNNEKIIITYVNNTGKVGVYETNRCSVDLNCSCSHFCNTTSSLCQPLGSGVARCSSGYYCHSGMQKCIQCESDSTCRGNNHCSDSCVNNLCVSGSNGDCTSLGTTCNLATGVCQ